MASNSPGGLYGGHFLSGDNGLRHQYGAFGGAVGGGAPGGNGLYAKDSGYYVCTSDGASTCSSNTTDASAEGVDGVGGTLLVLEPKSLRSFTTNDEYLFAMKEDLADWFTCLYHTEVTADSFLAVLETGVLLCQHANKVNDFARQRREKGEALEMRSYFIRSVPEHTVPFREGVKPETFQARDNVSNFISWSRQMGIPDVLSFETDDLVLRKNEKSVILCLLEVARVGAKLGMLAPTLVQMEEEIDAELAGEEPKPKVQIKTCDMRSLDERVRDLVGRCTCPVQFPLIKVSEGKYKIGDTRTLIFVRILRNHVMVRVGGGWDTLENYLNKHDPCQCNYRGHRPGPASHAFNHKVSVNNQRRASAPGQNAQGRPAHSTPTSPRRANQHARSISPQAAAAVAKSKTPNSFVISRSSGTHVNAQNDAVNSKNISNNNNNNNSNNASSAHATGGRTTPVHHNSLGGGASHVLPGGSTNGSTGSQQAQPIRCKSPSPGRLRSPSPRTTAAPAKGPASTTRPPVLRTSSSSSLLRGKGQESGRSAGQRRGGGPGTFASENEGEEEEEEEEDDDDVDGDDEEEDGEEREERGRVKGFLVDSSFSASLAADDDHGDIFQLDEELGVVDAAQLFGSVSFDERAEYEPEKPAESARGESKVGGDKANVSMDKISTMTLTEFKSLLSSALTVPEAGPGSAATAPPANGSHVGGSNKQQQQLNWDSLREKAKSVRDSLSSSVSSRRPTTSTSSTTAPNTPGRRSLPQSPMDDRARPVTDRPKTPLALRRGSSGNTSTIAPRPKTPTSSIARPKTPTSSIGSSRPKTPSGGVDRRDEYAMARAKTPNQMKRDAVAKVAGAISNWVESRSVMDAAASGSGQPSRPKTPTRPKTPVGSFHGSLVEENEDDDNDDEIAGHLANPAVQSLALGAVAKERPSTPSRIPKPCFTPRPETPKGSDSGIPRAASIPRPQSATPACQSRSGKPASRPMVISRSSSSNVRAVPEDTLPSPATSSHSEDMGQRRYHQSSSRPAAVISRKQPQTPTPSAGSAQNGSSKSYKDIHLVRRSVTPGPTPSRTQPARSVTPGPREKWSQGQTGSLNRLSSSYNNGTSSSQTHDPRRRASLSNSSHADESPYVVRNNTNPSDPSSMRRTSSSGDIDGPQMLLTNEITFSDDEEINELVKNAALKQHHTGVADEKRVRSASVDARKLARQAREQEVLLVRRDGSGNHGVKVTTTRSQQVKYDSTSKTHIVKRPASRGSSTDRSSPSVISRVRSQTPDPSMFKQARTAGAGAKQREPKSDGKPVNRTEAWVDSTLSDPKRKPPPRPKRATSIGNDIPASELEPRPLEDLKALLPEPQNGLLPVDTDNLDAPPEDPEMFRKMEKLFEKYREMELRASVNDTPGGGAVPGGGKGGAGAEATPAPRAPSQRSVNASSRSSVTSARTSSGSMGSSGGVSSSGRGAASAGSTGSKTTAKIAASAAAASTASDDSRFRRSTSVPNSFQAQQKQRLRSRTPSNVSSPAEENKSFGNNSNTSSVSGDGVSSLKDIDSQMAKDPTALMSKIKEILKVRPRKDEKAQCRTRIPAPASLSKAGRSKSVSNLTGSEGEGGMSNGLSITSHNDDDLDGVRVSHGAGRQRSPLTKANSTSSGNIAYSEFVYTDDRGSGVRATGGDEDDEVPDMTRTWSVQSDSSEGTNRCETPVPKLAMPLTTGRSTFINRRGDRLGRGLSQEKESNLSNSQSSLSSRSVLSATEDEAEYV